MAELPDPPGGGTNITKYVPQVYIGVFLNTFSGSPQLVFAAEMRNKTGNTNVDFFLALNTPNNRQKTRQILSRQIQINQWGN